MTPDERLDLIEARADAAMPGPWAATRTLLRSGCVGIAVHQRAGGTFVMVDRDREVRMEDAEFMAAAREDVPWLIGQLRDAEAALAAVRELHAPREEWLEAFGDARGPRCSHCHADDWPCPTVRALAAAEQPAPADRSGEQ